MVSNRWKHMAASAAGIILLLGLPLLRAENVWKKEKTDAVSSASVILEQPSGRYLVLIGKESHPNEEKLEAWETFFSGGDFSYLFEDIVCSVTASDPAAVEMAKSFQSRLPENQMKIQMEDTTLLFSRIEHGKYDVVILSEEMAERNGLTAENCKETKVVRVGFEDADDRTGTDGGDE